MSPIYQFIIDLYIIVHGQPCFVEYGVISDAINIVF